jgi:hypothetical protein
MATYRNIGELRKALREAQSSWQVSVHFKDDDSLPEYGLGASADELVLADEAAPKIKFKQILKKPINNPLLMQRWADLGYLKPSQKLKDLLRHPSEAPASFTQPHITPQPPEGTAAASVDWRLRWGWPWITSIRDQNGCNACWAFAGTALMEAMTRIEHAVWTTRSEGDVHKGVGKVCASLGGLGEVFAFISANGQCDPECFPWTTADIPYTPTADRNGRTVKIGTTTWIGSLNDQKTWIETIGPIATYFVVATDFFGYGGGIYRRTATATDVGGHFMLVVGYDDHQGCWIVKNSWGTGWGENGYCRIAYGESQIDTYSKLGLRDTNLDPLTKRRLHNGNLIESGNGALHRNFEMLSTVSGIQIRHWWREGASPFPWSKAAKFGKDAAHCPTLTATTYNRNFEAVYMTTTNRLHHWWYNQNDHKWYDGGLFGPKDAAGIPGFIQGNYHAPANFEVVVRTCGGRLNHWWRENGPPWNWHNGGSFGKNIALSAATLVQGRKGPKGNLELVCVLANGRMQHWWRDDEHGFRWKIRDIFGRCINTPPVMIEGQYGAADENTMGNYELCVAKQGQVEHWWRFNNGDGRWPDGGKARFSVKM